MLTSRQEVVEGELRAPFDRIVGREIAPRSIHEPAIAIGIANREVRREAVIRTPDKTEPTVVRQPLQILVPSAQITAQRNGESAIRGVPDFENAARIDSEGTVPARVPVVPALRSITQIEPCLVQVTEGPFPVCKEAGADELAVERPALPAAQRCTALAQPLKVGASFFISVVEQDLLVAAQEAEVVEIEVPVQRFETQSVAASLTRGIDDIANDAFAPLVVSARPHCLAVQLPDTVSGEQVRIEGTDETIIARLANARDHAAKSLVGGTLGDFPDRTSGAKTPPLDLKIDLLAEGVEPRDLGIPLEGSQNPVADVAGLSGELCRAEKIRQPLTVHL